MTRVVRQPGAGKATLAGFLRDIQGLSAQIGWFASAKYENGTQVAYVAAIQEYGYAPKHIPPRMGLRMLIVKQQQEWARFVERGAKIMLSGSGDAYAALTLMGAKAEGDIRRQIASVTEPILAIATQDARARRMGIDPDQLTATGIKPLVDTGLMIATVSHVVFKDGGKVAGKEKTAIGD